LNSINGFVTRTFDVLLAPLEWVGPEFALLVVSAIFGVLALWVFKHISWQKGIKATKDRIKGHLIEIRIYQDDLAVVSKAIGRVLVRNLQYLALNFGPFLPLAVPFTFVVAQLVVRYGFEPVPVTSTRASPALAGESQPRFGLAGDGLSLSIEGDATAIASLEVVLPEGLDAREVLARVPESGLAVQALVAASPGVYDIVLRTASGEVTKRLVAGREARTRTLQPERVTGLATLLWPAEGSLAGTGLSRVSFVYPESDLGWLPGHGPLGVILVFLVASMVVGFAALKPLGVQI
jgi:hypothetical protein